VRPTSGRVVAGPHTSGSLRAIAPPGVCGRGLRGSRTNESGGRSSRRKSPQRRSERRNRSAAKTRLSRLGRFRTRVMYLRLRQSTGVGFLTSPAPLGMCLCDASPRIRRPNDPKSPPTPEPWSGQHLPIGDSPVRQLPSAVPDLRVYARGRSVPARSAPSLVAFQETIPRLTDRHAKFSSRRVGSTMRLAHGLRIAPLFNLGSERDISDCGVRRRRCTARASPEYP
jgi:hypothetical protein